MYTEASGFQTEATGEVNGAYSPKGGNIALREVTGTPWEQMGTIYPTFPNILKGGHFDN